MKAPENIEEILDNDSWALSFFWSRWNEIEVYGSITQEYLLLFAHRESSRRGKNPRKVIDALLPYATAPNGRTLQELQDAQWGE
jgi:hypothetical protein